MSSSSLLHLLLSFHHCTADLPQQKVKSNNNNPHSAPTSNSRDVAPLLSSPTTASRTASPPVARPCQTDRYSIHSLAFTCVHLPIECNGISVTSFDVPIQEIIANVGRRSFHPLDGDRTLSNVKVVLQKFVGLRWSLPVKLLRNVRPKLPRLRNGLLVLLPVLLHSGDMGLLHYARTGLKHFILLRGHFTTSSSSCPVTQSLGFILFNRPVTD